MGKLDISQATASNMENRVDDFEVDTTAIKGPTGQKEQEFMIEDGQRNWDYFNYVPDLKAATLMKAIWNVGKGYTAKPPYEAQLEDIKGTGKDTFDDILFNLEVNRIIFGDSFAEIMRNDKGTLINLKVLNPLNMKVIIDENGIIIRYEQINNSSEKETINDWEPQKILHLSNNKLADQILGISDVKALKKTLHAEEQSFDDMIKIMHRQARPMLMFKLGTDNQAKIDAFVAKMDAVTNKGENIYIPDDTNSVEFEVVKVDVSSVVLSWRDDVRNKIFRGFGIPLVLFGAAGSTESGGKMEVFAHEQVFEHDQRYIEKQLWNQLAIKIDLIPPTSLLNNLQGDESKDANQGLEAQPQDLTAGAGE